MQNVSMKNAINADTATDWVWQYPNENEYILVEGIQTTSEL